MKSGSGPLLDTWIGCLQSEFAKTLRLLRRKRSLFGKYWDRFLLHRNQSQWALLCILLPSQWCLGTLACMIPRSCSVLLYQESRGNFSRTTCPQHSSSYKGKECRWKASWCILRLVRWLARLGSSICRLCGCQWSTGQQNTQSRRLLSRKEDLQFLDNQMYIQLQVVSLSQYWSWQNLQ